MPCLKHNNALSDLIRAAHVLHVNSYWGAFIRSVFEWIVGKITVAHYDLDPSPRDREVASNLLTLAYCPLYPKVSARVRGLRDELLDLAIGDWTSSSCITYACRFLGCTGGIDCVSRASGHLTHLLMQIMFH